MYTVHEKHCHLQVKQIHAHHWHTEQWSSHHNIRFRLESGTSLLMTGVGSWCQSPHSIYLIQPCSCQIVKVQQLHCLTVHTTLKG